MNEIWIDFEVAESREPYRRVAGRRSPVVPRVGETVEIQDVCYTVQAVRYVENEYEFKAVVRLK